MSKMCYNFICCFRGLLSEKPDDSLFFLDVGQPQKAKQKGKHIVTQLLNTKYTFPSIPNYIQ